MRFLIISASFYPDINGQVIYFSNLGRILTKQGHKVDIICSGKKEIKEKFHEINLIKYKKPSLWLNPKKRYILYRKLSFEKLKKLDYKKYDLVLVGGHIFLKDLKKIIDKDKIIWIVPSLRNIAKNIANKKEVIIRMKKEIKEAIKQINLVVLSNSIKKQFKTELGRTKKIIQINPGINLDKFSSTHIKKNYALFVGRISKEKNTDSMIRALSKTNNKKLIIVGDGPEEKKIKDLVKKLKLEKQVFFLGKKQDPSKYFNQSKIFILPSRYEAFGLVLLEAMASGLPCIAFKPDGKNILTASDEIIKDKITGFLVKDEAEMAEKIDLLLEDNNLREKLGKAARKQAEKYSWKKTADAILRLGKK